MSRAEKADSNRNLPPDQQNARNASVKTRRENLALGFDLGGTNLKTLLIDETGQVYHKSVKPSLWEQGIEVVLQSVTDAASLAKETASYLDMDIRGAGLGICGPFDYERGEMIESPLLPGLRNVPFAKLASDCIELPVLGENDANLAILGEWWKGVGRRDKVVAGLTLGTGVGGGIILDDRLWHGADGMAGEIGHMTIVPDGRRCSCGNRGCLEAYASATAILNRTIEGMPRHPENNLLEMAQIKNPSELTSEKIFQAACAGNELAKEIFCETGAYLGLAIGSLINILNPEIFIIGGGASRAWDFFYPAMMKEIGNRALKEPAERIIVVPTKLGNDAGLVGACGLVAKSLDQPAS